ncbi:MAG: ABC transporter permease, partial [Firmicutes bacterium]|nr:ABC transporter permease [Bacillota bacterium]
MTENIRISFRGIWSHKMRSFLTMLGIIIGIAAIIAIVSTIKGTNEQIKNNLIGDGTNTVVVNLSENDWEAEFSSGDIHEGIKPLDEDIRQDILDADGVESVS